MDDREEPSDEHITEREEWQTLPRGYGNRAFRIKHVLWVLLGILAFIVVMSPVVREQRKKMDRSHTMNCSKSIYLVLMDFESDFGRFPDDESAAKETDLHQFRGDTANDYLGQLIAGGYTKSEMIFHTNDRRYEIQLPDDVISPPSRIMEKNECGFSYVMAEVNGKRRGLSTDDHGSLPILVSPLVDKGGTCDASSFANYGVYLRIDGSVMSERLRSSDQRIPLKQGGTIFESGPGTMWGNLKPVVLLPDR